MDEPTPHVRDRFGASGPGQRLPGGQGNSWRYGDRILKPLDLPLDVLTWQAEHLPALQAHSTFRVVPPLAATDGELIVDGWTAWPRVEGTHQPNRWPDIIAVGTHFHDALRQLPQPQHLYRRTDRWAVADRIAWGEYPAPPDPYLTDILAATHDIPAENQLVHGDLTGNVLFHDDLPPAVIDLSLYWRPPAYATGIVITDAIAFEKAPTDLADGIDRQYLLRAIAFRLATDLLAGVPDAAAPYQRI